MTITDFITTVLAGALFAGLWYTSLGVLGLAIAWSVLIFAIQLGRK